MGYAAKNTSSSSSPTKHTATYSSPSKSSPTYSFPQKSGQGSAGATIAAGTPMGLLLLITYPTQFSVDGSAEASFSYGLKNTATYSSPIKH